MTRAYLSALFRTDSWVRVATVFGVLSALSASVETGCSGGGGKTGVINTTGGTAGATSSIGTSGSNGMATATSSSSGTTGATGTSNSSGTTGPTGTGGSTATSGTTSGVCPAGAEKCPCYGNQTCDMGLTCASDLCVRLGATGGTSTTTNGTGATSSGASTTNGSGVTTGMGDASAGNATSSGTTGSATTSNTTGTIGSTGSASSSSTGAGPTTCGAAFEVGSDGFVRMPGAGGTCWHGYAYVGGDSASSVSPMNFSTCGMPCSLKMMGTIGGQSSSVGFIGFNVSQEPGAAATTSSPAGGGLTVSFSASTNGLALRAQLTTSDGTLYCSDIKTPSPVTIPYLMFKTNCWTTTGLVYARQPIKSFQLNVLGNGTTATSNVSMTLSAVQEN